MPDTTSMARTGEPVEDGGRGRRRPHPLMTVLAAVVAAAGVTGLALFVGDEGGVERGGEREAAAASGAKVGVFRGTSLSEVHAFEEWSGRRVDYVVDFSTRETWQDIADPQLLLREWRGTRYRVVHGLAMLPESDPTATMEAGARGEYDHHYAALGRRLVDAGQADAILRLGWEFNLEGSRWTTGDPQVFVTYWRSVIAAMRSAPGQRFEFDWNVNNGTNAYDAQEYYPGDDVVDYVGVDAYDMAWIPDTYPYPADCDPSCRQARQDRAWRDGIYGGARGLGFWAQFAAQHRKPLSLPEWGLWERPDGHGGGENPSFIRRMHAFIAANNVAYHAYFEYNAADGPHRLMETFPRSATEYRRLFGGS